MVRKTKINDNPTICFCNGIKRQSILTAIQKGAKTLTDIYDSTHAGVGACGGSCRRNLVILLEDAQKKTT